MELWIKVQKNKQLNQGICKVDNLFVEKDEEDKNKWIIKQWGCDTLGIYKTEKRVLEVLDEIQNKLMPISVYKQEVDNLTIDFKNIDTIVYEMPKE